MRARERPGQRRLLARGPSTGKMGAQAGVVLVFGLLTLLCGALLTRHVGTASAPSCASGDMTYSVATGDTLGGIATRYQTTWQQLASYNHLADPNAISTGQTICLPGNTSALAASGKAPSYGNGNPFPYGQCTWWADQRYFQLHGTFVPWRTQSDAWQWAARARDFDWHVSTSPVSGAIIDLQPWVQGAYGLGHVAVVERVLGNGDVLASNMNWGTPWRVTDVEFAPGPGVSFISSQ